MYLAAINCKKIYSLAQIGAFFGVGINGVSSNTQKVKDECINNRTLKKTLKEIDSIIASKHEN